MIKNLKSTYKNLRESSDESVLKTVTKVLKCDDSQTLIEAHALAGTTANFGLSLIPVAGGVLSFGALIYLTYHMYHRLNKIYGISIKGHVLAYVARIVFSNLSGNVLGFAGTILISIITSNIPVLREFTSLEIAAATFSSLYSAGIVYDEIIRHHTTEIKSMQSDDWKQVVYETVSDINVNKISNDAYNRYYESHKEN